ncbi:hypothetical protein EBT16_00850 [bacterium]|nr:hypothetical protein [bacterium]
MTVSPEDPCIEVLKKRYQNLNALVFYRSLEKARDQMDFFEILESVPDRLPFSWDENEHAWVKDNDIIAQKKLKNIRKR